MALRDTWHRTLVYFGLAEEDDSYRDEPMDVEPEEEIESRYRDRPNVRRLERNRRRRDEIDDIFADEGGSGARAETRVLRSVGAPGGGGGGNGRSMADVQVHLVVPKNFNDAQQVADRYKDSVPVILNLQTTDTDLSKRLIDFASGLTYALDGGMQRIADKVFLLTPRNVEVSAEERARLIEKGFFNQS
jgi:cell division inhibitor SepF